MIVEVQELGKRPNVWTKPRRFAPQAIHALAQYLSSQEFAEKGFVVLDWTNELGQLPYDAVKPVIYVQVVKAVPDIGQTVRVENRFDVDDVFGSDFVTPTILVDLVHDLKLAVERNVARRKEEFSK